MKEIEATLEDIKKLGAEKSPKVIEELLQAVVDIQPMPHRNFAAKTA